MFTGCAQCHVSPWGFVFSELRQCSCRCAAREVRRIENAATAPVLTCYRESYRHAATARSLGLAQHLLRRLHHSIDNYVAAILAGIALSQWLALRLQLLSALLVAGLAFLAVASTTALSTGVCQCCLSDHLHDL